LLSGSAPGQHQGCGEEKRRQSGRTGFAGAHRKYSIIRRRECIRGRPRT
jgi:hypothetical protein